MIELMLPHLSAAALLAVAGAAHCVGMCGGIGTALTFTVPAARREGLLALKFNLCGFSALFPLLGNRNGCQFIGFRFHSKSTGGG